MSVGYMSLFPSPYVGFTCRLIGGVFGRHVTVYMLENYLGGVCVGVYGILG